MTPPMPAPLDPQVRQAVETDIRAGVLSRNAIARTHHVATGTVSRIARQLEDAGEAPAFDRSKVETATRARLSDLAARRAQLADDLLADAVRLRGQLWEACTFGQFGGKENVWSEVELPQPRFTDQSTILGAVEKAVKTSKALTDEGADPAEQGKAAVLQLVEGLRVVEAGAA